MKELYSCIQEESTGSIFSSSLLMPITFSWAVNVSGLFLSEAPATVFQILNTLTAEPVVYETSKIIVPYGFCADPTPLTTPMQNIWQAIKHLHTIKLQYKKLI